LAITDLKSFEFGGEQAWINKAYIERDVSQRWFYCLKHVQAISEDDNYSMNCCAVTFREKDDDDSSLDYPMKWGLEEEMTLHTDKSGRSGHETPFQFMERAFVLKKIADRDQDQEAFESYKMLIAKYIEFTVAYKGVKQLRYDKGLKSLFGLAEPVSSPSAGQAEEQEEEIVGPDYQLIKSLTRPEAYRLFKVYAGVYKLLKESDTGDVKKIEDFVAKL
jgi:hypothetical protein